MVLPGEVGKYDNIRFVMSTSGYYSATGGATSGPVHIMPIFGADAFARSRITGKELQAMVRSIDTPAPGDELGQTGSIGWKAYFVPKILDQNKIQRYEFYGA